MMTGVKLIEQEREHNARKFTPAHDDAHTRGDLAVIAAILAVKGTDACVEDPLGRVSFLGGDSWGLIHKHEGHRVKMLAVAGGLIAAEIDRFLRCEQRSLPTGHAASYKLPLKIPKKFRQRFAETKLNPKLYGKATITSTTRKKNK